MQARASAFSREVNGLTAPTRSLLAAGAEYWSIKGPGSVDDELRHLMNVTEDHRGFARSLGDIAQRLRRADPVAVLDLTRALLLTELAITSAVIGPSDWHNVYGNTSIHWRDSTITDFKQLLDAQLELGKSRIPVSGTDPFGKHPLPD